MHTAPFSAAELPMNDTAARAVELFRSAYGTAPAVTARAPGRVEVLGNHTDYNEGFVLSCAIDRDIVVALSPSDDGRFHFLSTHYPEPITTGELQPIRDAAWTNYPLGVCAMIRERGIECPPFRIAVNGNIPLGAGLSSSAALEVGTGVALRALYELGVGDEDLARIGQKAENVFAGAQCGLLDQFSSLFGRRDQLLFTDFRTLEHETIPLPRADLALVLTMSGVTHSLAASAYNDRRAECAQAAAYFAARDSSVKTLRDIDSNTLAQAREQLDPVVYRRALHIVGEDEGVLHGRSLLEDGDLAGFGRLLYESHRSSKENFENSCPELDRLVDIAGRVEGVFGSRLTGGGFGGATLTLLPEQARERFTATVREQYRTPDGAPPETYAAKIADGAGVVDGL